MKKWIIYCGSVFLLSVGVLSFWNPVQVGAIAAPVGGGGSSAPTPTAQQDICGSAGSKCNAFVDKYINPFIILLSGLVGVIAVISIIVAGIQYAGSADDPSIVSKAKQRIFNTVVGLLAYIFLFAFLNYLIPGGIL